MFRPVARQYNQEKTFLKVERWEGKARSRRGRTRVWFNEDLESKNYFVPGLVAVIMSIIGVLSPGR
jgi:ABC-2 type transport system permease protein